MTAKIIKDLTKLNESLKELVLSYSFNESMLKYANDPEEKRNIEYESETLSMKITDIQEEQRLLINHLIN